MAASRPPKVALVVTTADSAVLMRGWAQYLIARGWQVHFVSAAGDPQAAVAAEGATVHSVAMRRSISPLSDLRALIQLIRLFHHERFDVVHSSTPKAGLLGTVGAFIACVPCRVYTLRGLQLDVGSRPRRAVLWTTEAIAFALSTVRLAIGETLRERARAARLPFAGRLQVLHNGSSNGVDADFFVRHGRPGDAAKRAEVGIEPDAVVVGYVGRLVPDKGIGDLIHAWSWVRDRNPDARLVLVGTTEAHAPLEPVVLEALDADPTVLRPGWQANVDLLAWYEAMDVLVLPTHREGFGNVLLEAAAMALPTIGTNGTGCADAVVDGVTGVLVDPREPMALARAIDGLLKDPGLRERLGHAGRRRVCSEFRREDIWAGLLAIYDTSLRDHREPTTDAVKVLHVFGRMDRGGAELRTLDVVHGLDRAMVESSFLTLKTGPGELDALLTEVGAEVIECPLNSTFPVRFFRLLHARRVDVVHSHVHDFSGVILLIARCAGVPSRIAHYRSTSDGKPASLLRKAQRGLKRTLVEHNATAILAVSSGVMSAARGDRWASDPRCRVVYNGVDADRLMSAGGSEVRDELGLGDRPIVLVLANATPAKNHARALAIFAELLATVPDAVLLLAGSGPMVDVVRESALAGSEAVRVLGQREDVPALLAASNVLLSPSVREGLPGAVLEAAAAGRPVIASCLPGAQEIAAQVRGITLIGLDEVNSRWVEAIKEGLARPRPAVSPIRGTPFELGRARSELVAIWKGKGGAA